MNTREEAWVRSFCAGLKVPTGVLCDKVDREIAYDNAVAYADKLLRLFDKRFPQAQEDKRPCVQCGGFGLVFGGGLRPEVPHPCPACNQMRISNRKANQ